MKRSIFLAAMLILVSIGLVFGGGGTQQQGASVDARTVRQSITFNGYPMQATNQTVSWFATDGYVPNEIYAHPQDSPFHFLMQEMLGVNIEWIFPIRGTPGNQAINLVLASGDLPDIMYGGLMADAERHIEEGVFHDLSPYIREWSPAYWRLLQSDPAYDRAMKTDTGRYYGYGFFREDGGYPDTYQGPVVNKAWLDECGLPLPVTIADWDITLRTFRDRYGAVISMPWPRVSGSYGGFISGAYGAHAFASYRLYIDNNNRVQIGNIMPEYRAFITKMHEWWREGLIDQDLLTINDTMARSNALNLRTGLTFTSMGQLSNWVIDSEAAGNGANWIGLQYPRGNDGTLAHIDGGYGIGANLAAVITTNVRPERMELVMRVLDYAYTEEGDLYWNYGKRGNSWDYGPDGIPMFLPLLTNDPHGLNNTIDRYVGTAWNANGIQATRQLILRNTTQSIDALNLWYWPNQNIAARSKLPPGITLTPSESTRIGELEATISTFINEASAHFLTGQANINTWDSYVARVNAMGAPELLRIYQAALDRYLAR